MSLFEKPLDSIDFADLQAFCNQKIPENLSIEYKRGFSSKNPNQQVAKLACAFANANGGLVIFGIKEKQLADKRGVPDTIEGMPAIPSPAESIRKICISNINPPLFVEVRDVPHADPNKVITIMRVPESEQTPHFLNADGCAYVRVDDISHPLNDGKVATPVDLEWLTQRRKKPNELRESLVKRARERSIPGNAIGEKLPSVQISIVPLYPRETVFDLSELNEKLPVLFRLVGQEQGRSAPDTFYYKVSKLSGGLVTFTNSEDFTYLEFTRMGLVFLAYCANKGGERDLGLNAIVFLKNLTTLLQGAMALYQGSNFYGLLRVTVNFAGIKGKKLVFPLSGTPSSASPIIDSDSNISRTQLASNLVDDEFLLDLYNEFLWSMGAGPDYDYDGRSTYQLNEVRSKNHPLSFY